MLEGEGAAEVAQLEEAIESPGLLDDFLRDLQLSSGLFAGLGEHPPNAGLHPLMSMSMSMSMSTPLATVAAPAADHSFLLEDYACLYATAAPAPHPAAHPDTTSHTLHTS